jgi:molybdenum cofactor guanylyltransferase
VKSLLQLRKLRKSVAGRLLFDIDEFTVPENTCIILSGQNGVGKTTLLKILAGLEAPDQTEIIYRGENLSWHAARRRLQRDIVYLHQHPYMFDCSVAENIAYGLRHARVPRARIQARVRQALEWAGLAHLAARNARHLSGGEKQRVALSRAQVLAPRLLLLDEPLANMDHEAREHAIFLIRRLKSEGISSIVTSHEPDIATLLGDDHRHLCKTGPCRHTLVIPFLYQRDIEQEQRLAGASDRSVARGTDPGHAADAARATPGKEITAVILAGGRARRMGGQDKGLLELAGRPMIEHIITVLAPQVSSLLINANRNLERYREYGLPVIPDLMGEFFGPLVGMASGMQAAKTRYLLTVPCDSPFVPAELAAILHDALQDNRAEISAAHDGQRIQPVFALLRCDLLPDLLAYLDQGGRKIDTWYARHRLALADFSRWPDAFLNINTPEDRREVERRLKHPPSVTPAS